MVALRAYRELRPLAQGGMAVLTLAQRDDDLEVVIKRIRPPFDHDASYRALFLDEGRIASALDHPRIVQLLDQGEDDLGPYLVFEHVEGTDLGCVLNARCDAGRPLELAELLAIAIPLLDALGAAHEARGDDGEPLELVHRDISPGNVLIGESGEVKLADFGVARSRLKTEHTVAGEMKGKFAYMAPEQTRGECRGPTTDLFAVGIVLFECATGTRLFDGPTDADIAIAVRELSCPRARSRNPALPEALDALIDELLSKDPEARPATAEQVKARLEEIAIQHGLERGLRRHAAALAHAHPRAAVSEHPHVTELRRRTQRVMGEAPQRAPVRRRGLIALGLGLVGLISLGASQLLDGDEAPPARPALVGDLVVPNGMSVEPAPEVKAQPVVARVDPEPKPVVQPKPRPVVRQKPAVRQAPVASGFGKLSLSTEPWATVSVDGKALGVDTPVLGLKLAAGRHRIKLVNPHFKVERTIEVEIKKDQETRRFVDLNKP